MTPVSNVVPVVWGEFGEDDCGSGTVALFLPYADLHISAVEAWTWDTWGSCESLIGNYNGMPANAYGTFVRAYYLAH